jgi:hypothetical protein
MHAAAHLPAKRSTRKARLLAVMLITLCTPATIFAQGSNPVAGPEAEFHMARLIYDQIGGRGRGFGGRGLGWYAIDYPAAEYHLTRGLRRLTRLDVAEDSFHVRSLDERIFDYPWLFVQQIGNWRLTAEEGAMLREYVLRGGFMVVDDFHGVYDWAVFVDSIRLVFPDLPIIDIPDDDTLLHVLYDLDQRTQIPGRRHLYCDPRGETTVNLPGGPPRWRGIYDDSGRLLVAINYNMDMGDAWEHADDPCYPEPMTALAYRFGINYVIYAMTH